MRIDSSHDLLHRADELLATVAHQQNHHRLPHPR
jgi:hypothetical protein